MEAKPADDVGKAFRFLLLNKCSHDGLCRNPKGGEAQRGRDKVDYSYKPDKLRRQIQEVHRLVQGRLTVTELAVVDYLKQFGFPQTTGTYFDPPYVDAGAAIYRDRAMSCVDHIELAECLTGQENWLMSVDAATLVKFCYSSFQMVDADDSMGTQRGMTLKKRTELLVMPHGGNGVRLTPYGPGHVLNCAACASPVNVPLYATIAWQENSETRAIRPPVCLHKAKQCGHRYRSRRNQKGWVWCGSEVDVFLRRLRAGRNTTLAGYSLFLG